RASVRPQLGAGGLKKYWARFKRGGQRMQLTNSPLTRHISNPPLSRSVRLDTLAPDADGPTLSALVVFGVLLAPLRRARGKVRPFPVGSLALNPRIIATIPPGSIFARGRLMAGIPPGSGTLHATGECVGSLRDQFSTDT